MLKKKKKDITYLYQTLAQFCTHASKESSDLCWGHTASSGSNSVAKSKHKQKIVVKCSATTDAEHTAYVQEADRMVPFETLFK